MAVCGTLRHNNNVTALQENADWNSFGRANASQKWRRQSAAMGNDMTRAIVAAAQVQPGMCALDIACGAGEPANARVSAGRGHCAG